ncbi:MAG TPA: phosphatase PAP2 family protein [Dokdonella sp.]|uniref:phosphatase PAP2 family protein n=1 Tax=Dokdonella sp. TaxID=2291710 RepID=UPI002C796EB7|nr:phosphatase PAP2 family protein [Dokdonella sp.]HUD41433.1 phosphatase PAP2 family protein [Dokdonella sp.]
MNRRLVLWTAAIAAALMLIGLAGLDVPLAQAIRAAGLEDAALFRVGLDVLDTVLGVHLWFWLAGTVCIATGSIGLLWPRPPLPRRLPAALFAAGLVQVATIATMIQGKNAFGRLRPIQLFESGDWSRIWFAGGGSFPSGHGAFYFGLFLPLAAIARPAWLRATLLAVPTYVVIARIDLARHFLSDVMASALIAALYALVASFVLRRWLPPR